MDKIVEILSITNQAYLYYYNLEDKMDGELYNNNCVIS